MPPRSRLLTKAQRQFEYYRARKQELVERLGGECQACGYGKSVAALHFHHKDPAKKTRGFNARTWSQRHLTPEFYEELDGCELLCSNCHAELHERMTRERLFSEHSRTEAPFTGMAAGGGLAEGRCSQGSGR